MVDDIGLKLKGRRNDHEWTLAANGTVTPNALVMHNGTGIVVATAGAVNVIGAESGGQTVTTGNGVTFKAAGIARVATFGRVVVGKPIKAGPGGKAVEFLDTNLVGGALGDFTTKTGGNFANQPANDTVDVVSSAAGDVGQTVTVYGKQNGGNLVSETFILNGITEDVGATAFDRIHAVVVSGAHAGTVSVHEHSGTLDITTLATGTNSIGRYAVANGYAYCGKPDIVASGASTKYAAVYGLSETGAAISEELQFNGATEVPTTLNYSQVTYVHLGDLESARTASGLIADEVDDELAKVGTAITGVASAGTIYAILK